LEKIPDLSDPATGGLIRLVLRHSQELGLRPDGSRRSAAVISVRARALRYWRTLARALRYRRTLKLSCNAALGQSGKEKPLIGGSISLPLPAKSFYFDWPPFSKEWDRRQSKSDVGSSYRSVWACGVIKKTVYTK
jgi:hypothetical protein